MHFAAWLRLDLLSRPFARLQWQLCFSVLLGTSLPVTVLASGAAETTLTSDISYAVPSLEGLAGCTQGSTPASVVQCDRAGGEVVTLTGSNFGPSGAAVLIGDLACKSVAHDPTTPHNKLTCILPSGGGEALPVRILQRNTADASQNSSPLSLSYATCGLGVQPISYATYLSQSSLALGDCVPCQEGTFSDDFSHDRVGSISTYGSFSCCFLLLMSLAVVVFGYSARVAPLVDLAPTHLVSKSQFPNVKLAR